MRICAEPIEPADMMTSFLAKYCSLWPNLSTSTPYHIIKLFDICYFNI